MKFSCCQPDKLVRVCLSGRQERCQNAVALFGYLPAIGARNFGNQAMGVQQCQSPRDLGGLGALLFFVVGLPKQQGPDVAVAKALQSPFAPVDGGQQLGIGGSKGLSARCRRCSRRTGRQTLTASSANGVVMLAAARAVRYRSLAALEIWARR